MPEWMGKAQEKDFEAASKIVKKDIGKNKLKDDDYALVMHIWKNMEKAHRGNKKKKKKSELVSDMILLANELDSRALFNHADKIDLILSGLAS